MYYKLTLNNMIVRRYNAYEEYHSISKVLLQEENAIEVTKNF